jgi:integrase
MAICKDKTRNKYYISYKWKTPDGSYKSENIKNKDWNIEGANKVSIRYLRSIEQIEIAKDMEKKKYNYHEGGDMSLGNLVEMFCNVMLTQALDKETINNYKSAFKNYLYPICPPHTPVDRCFTTLNIDRFRINLSQNGFAPSTVNNKLVAVKKLLQFAKKRKLISRDMADDAIDLLEPLKRQSRRLQTNNYFHNGDEDFQKFLSTFENEDEEWRIPILTMFYGALRIGEWQAITLEDCNFDNCTIHINKQIDNHGKVKMKTKTGEDKTIRLPRPFMEQLKDFISEQRINPKQTIFVGSHGSHIGRNTIRRVMNKHIEMSNLPHLTPHGLRHSFATRMFDKGYDLKEIQNHLGHASMETTMNYYLHLTQKNNDDKFDDLL